MRPLLMQAGTARRAVSTFIGGFVHAVVGIVGLLTGYYSDASKLRFLVTCLVILSLIVALIRWIGRLTRLGDVTEAIDLVEEAARAAGAGHSYQARGAGLCAGDRHGRPRGLDQAVGRGLAPCLAAGNLCGTGPPAAVAAHPLGEATCRRIRNALLVGSQRTFEADPRFGLTVLSGIGSRALSPGVNVFGTAIDVVTTVVRLLAGWADAAAKAEPEVLHPRLQVEPIAVADLLRDAFRWIARDEAGQFEVQI